jgi:hypothetical protein
MLKRIDVNHFTENIAFDSFTAIVCKDKQFDIAPSIQRDIHKFT